MKSLTNLAGNLDVSTAQVLTALRIVATRADVEKLIHWTEKELEGYQEEDELPSHRIWKLTIKATLHNSYQGQVKNVHVGDLAIDKKYREKATTYDCLDGIWQLEDSLSNLNLENTTCGSMQPNLAQLINASKTIINDGWVCTHATAEFSPNHLKGVINHARQTALKFCLECEKEGIDLRWGEGDDTVSEDQAKWTAMIKKEGTKVALKSIWDTVWTGIVP